MRENQIPRVKDVFILLSRVGIAPWKSGGGGILSGCVACILVSVIVEAAVRVYRLHRAIHDPRSGHGAERFGGRWNHPGVAIVYTAEARSLPVLECVVHTSLISI
jgi:hypothetical protein